MKNKKKLEKLAARLEAIGAELIALSDLIKESLCTSASKKKP